MTRRDTWDTWLGKRTINPLYLIALHILHAAQHQARVQWVSYKQQERLRFPGGYVYPCREISYQGAEGAQHPYLGPCPHILHLLSKPVLYQKQTQNWTREMPWSRIPFGLLTAAVPKIQAISIHTLQRILKVNLHAKNLLEKCSINSFGQMHL